MEQEQELTNTIQMRATGDKLVEKYIIPIARELAEALKAVHEAGIIHRDVKGKHQDNQDA